MLVEQSRYDKLPAEIREHIERKFYCYGLKCDGVTNAACLSRQGILALKKHGKPRQLDRCKSGNCPRGKQVATNFDMVLKATNVPASRVGKAINELNADRRDANWKASRPAKTYQRGELNMTDQSTIPQKSERKQCVTEGCTRKLTKVSAAKGDLCSICRRKAEGRQKPKQPSRICSVDGCERQLRGNSQGTMCYKHHMGLEPVDGDQKPKKPKSASKSTSVTDATAEVNGKWGKFQEQLKVTKDALWTATEEVEKLSDMAENLGPVMPIDQIPELIKQSLGVKDDK
jgi:hypothetical protein